MTELRRSTVGLLTIGILLAAPLVATTAAASSHEPLLGASTGPGGVETGSSLDPRLHLAVDPGLPPEYRPYIPLMNLTVNEPPAAGQPRHQTVLDLSVSPGDGLGRYYPYIPLMNLTLQANGQGSARYDLEMPALGLHAQGELPPA